MRRALPAQRRSVAKALVYGHGFVVSKRDPSFDELVQSLL